MDLKRYSDCPFVFLLVVIAGGTLVATVTCEAVHLMRGLLSGPEAAQWTLYLGALLLVGVIVSALTFALRKLNFGRHGSVEVSRQIAH